MNPDGWRWRFEDQTTWHVQKNKPKWYTPDQKDIVIEPLFSLNQVGIREAIEEITYQANSKELDDAMREMGVDE